MADYPGAIKTFSTLVDLADSVLAAHQNDRGGEITAIQTELGTDPAGTHANVKTRLEALEDYDQQVLGSTFGITAAAGTFEDTGLSVTLPEAGTYLITCDVRATMVPNTGTGWYIAAKLYNSTDAADVTNSERMCTRSNAAASGLRDSTTPINIIVTVAASKVIKLYAKRDGGGTPTFTQSDISSDSSGRTTMIYRRVA